MRTWLGLLISCGSLLLTACGGAAAGEDCSASGFLCADERTALECRVGKWTALPCRGPQGCSVADGTVTCDMSLNQQGDACAAKAEGEGLCTSTGDATLECRQGKLVLTNSCSSCTMSADEVICNQ